MASILVGHSYFLRFDRKQWERAKPYPPLATLQVAEALRRAGHQVAFFDAMLAQDVQEFEQQLEALRPQWVLLYEDNFNYLTKMCLGKMRGAACEMLAAATRRGARTIAAGADASDEPGVYLASGADLVLIGEAIDQLLTLMTRFDGDAGAPVARLIEGLPGVASKTVGKPRRAPVSASPHAPQPSCSAAWDLLNIESYRTVWRAAHGFFSLNMAASRGCSFRCNWCAKPIWGNQYLQREADEVAAEMAHIKRAFNPEHVWFADDIFGFRVDWINAFAAAARSGGGAIPFTIQTRADLLSERMAVALRDAGCYEAWIGAESGSQRVLDAMNKGTTVAQIIAGCAQLRAVGIRVGLFIQLGYLEEELEDLLATRALIERIRPDDIGVSVAYPLPGTKFHEQIATQLGEKTRWQDSGDLEMMFQGTYVSDFYRAIRDLLHAQVSDPAQPELPRRWQELLLREHQFRSRGPAGGVAIGAPVAQRAIVQQR
jgi:anaerobic magnesium-protoporphyrin IX monomethyl ester cyclase